MKNLYIENREAWNERGESILLLHTGLKGGPSYSALARQFGVSKSRPAKIIRGELYRHLVAAAKVVGTSRRALMRKYHEDIYGKNI